MSLGSTLQALMKLAHVALVAILLVGVPMADAATCAGEELSGTIESGIASDQALVAADVASTSGDHDAQMPGDAQHCIHGHCHHTTPFKECASVVQVVAASTTSVAPLGTDMVLAHMSAGLERPPKI